MAEWLNSTLGSLWPLLQLVYAVFLGGAVLERVFPAERGQPWRHLAFNVVYTALFLFMTVALLPPLQAITAPWIASHGGWVPVRLPDTALGVVAFGLLYMLIYDFFYYWFHRAQHTFRPLWAQHRLHHSDTSLNVTTSGRHHWLEEPVRVFLLMLPLMLVFDMRPPGAGWMGVALLLWPFFIHMNLRLPLGPLTPVLAGPQLHRIHHSVEPHHANRNFAAFFPVWDILFGSYHAPGKAEYPRTGLGDGEDLNNLWVASVSPFRDWWRDLRGTAAQALPLPVALPNSARETASRD